MFSSMSKIIFFLISYVCLYDWLQVHNGLGGVYAAPIPTRGLPRFDPLSLSRRDNAITPVTPNPVPPPNSITPVTPSPILPNSTNNANTVPSSNATTPIPSINGIPAFIDPRTNGGAWLNQAATINNQIVGEPLNVVISTSSSPEILQVTKRGKNGEITEMKGLLNWANAVGFDRECLGLHMGAPQKANLGDGKGFADQAMELRAHFGIPAFGTCIESLVGGNHFRVFRQDGDQANTGALFLAVSSELDVRQHHNIITDGYNIGRKDLISKAVGIRTWNGVTYNTTSVDLVGYLESGNQGVNHGVPVDGIVTVLTVTIVK